MNCIIVDDDPIARGSLEHFCELSEYLNLKGNFESAVEALNFIKGNSVDVIFLDVEMPEMNGLEMLQTFDLSSAPMVVLVTSKEDYAVDAFEYNVVDYLLKPVDYVRFVKSVNKMVSLKSKANGDDDNEFFVKSDLKFVKLGFNDILYVEAMADYVIIHIQGGRHIIHSTMKGIDAKLYPENFVRVHRSFIINIKMIKSVDNSSVSIADKNIPIGASYKSNFMEKLRIL
jgi:DNA-binding LytR/AlgR family response regulator